MFANVAVTSPAHFKAPNVIANIATSDQIRLDEIDQIAIDGCPVKTKNGHFMSDLSVGHRSGCSLQELQDGDPRSSPL